MKITAYNDELPLVLSGAGGIIVQNNSRTSLGSNTPLIESGAGSPGSGPQAAAWDHVHPEFGGGGGSSSFGSNSTRVSSVSSAGASSSNSRADHVHQGVASIAKAGSSALFGDVTLTGGTNVTLTQSGNDISIASSGGGGTAGLVLLEQHTASASASLDFTAWYSSTYDEYMLEFVNIIPATNGTNLWMQMSINGGSSYDATSGHYGWAGDFTVSGARASTGNTSDTHMELGRSISSTASLAGACGSMRLFAPANTSVNKVVTGYSANASTGNANTACTQTYCGFFTQTSAYDAFRLLMSSGNIASGIARIYGIVK